MGYFSGFEAHAAYADVLVGGGEMDAAVARRDEALRKAKRLPAHSRRMNQPWLKQLERVGAR